MRLTRMLGLALVGAIATIALAGAGLAMANTSTALCKVSTNICPAGSLYAAGTPVEGLAMKPILLGTFSSFTGEVLCEHSLVSGETTSTLTKPLKVTITNISFSGGCHSSFGGTCALTTVKTGELDLLRTGSNVGTATSLGNEVRVECNGFPSVECTFGGEPMLKAEGSPAKALTASNATLVSVTGPKCPSNPRWDAKYSITNPSGSIFITE